MQAWEAVVWLGAGSRYVLVGSRRSSLEPAGTSESHAPHGVIARASREAIRTQARCWLLSQFVQVVDKRHHRAVVALDSRVGGFDQVVLFGAVCAAAVAQADATG